MSRAQTVGTRLSDQIRRAPGQTAAELAVTLFGPGAPASRIQFPLEILVRRGKVCRRDRGGRTTPYRYFPAQERFEAAPPRRSERRHELID